MYTTTGLGPRQKRKMAGVYYFLVYMRADPKYSNLYIQKEMVYTSHFIIFSKPKPGGGVYIYI